MPQTVKRITDIFPAEQQATVRQQLSLARLVKAGTVTEAEARLRSAHPDDLAALLR